MLKRTRLLTLLGALLVSAPQAALAENPISEFLGGLFGGGGGGGRRATAPQPQEMPAPRVRRIIPHRESRTPTYWHGQSDKPRRAARKPDSEGGGRPSPTRASAPSDAASATPATSGAPANTPAPVAPTFFIATIGDNLGQTLANGLTAGFVEKPDIAVLKRAKESSGLVRDDFYDWPKVAKEVATAPQKINVAVVMLGSNDRQPLRRNGETLEPFSPQWRDAYVARVDAVLAAFKEKSVPIVWVGLPVMKSEHFSGDMAKLNDIFRERVARAGGTYVDLWESMADEKGQYSAFGPDINGQIVKLRAADGVNLTEAGGRSVAHFVETEIKKIYEGRKQPVPQAAVKTEASQGKPVVFHLPVAGPSKAPTLPERPAIGEPQSLDAPFGGTADLARRVAGPADASSSDAAKALAQHVFVEGGDQATRPNRADDYAWRGAAGAKASASQP